MTYQSAEMRYQTLNTSQCLQSVMRGYLLLTDQKNIEWSCNHLICPNSLLKIRKAWLEIPQTNITTPNSQLTGNDICSMMKGLSSSTGIAVVVFFFYFSLMAWLVRYAHLHKLHQWLNSEDKPSHSGAVLPSILLLIAADTWSVKINIIII